MAFVRDSLFDERTFSGHKVVAERQGPPRTHVGLTAAGQ